MEQVGGARDPVQKCTAEVQPVSLSCDTMNCAYCGQPATLRIPAMPDQVCRIHAIEFWTGLLAFTSQRTGGDSEEAPDQELAVVASNDLTWHDAPSEHRTAA
jgi:hypothetical protein